MEAEDRVISEVHYFSKEAKCHETNLKGGKEDFLNSHDNDCKRERKLDDLNGKPLEEKEGDQYTCLLGSNGQVVLWSPLFETVLSRFEFSYPCYMLDSIPKEKFCATIDNDGDLEVVRKNKINKKDGVILIEHQSSTTLDLVGEQVWRGAFYLSDYILNNPKTFKGKSILELASGVGLTSIVAGMVCRKIITTDVDKGDILDLIDRNMKRNKDYCLARTFIKEIDFYDLRTMDDLDSLLDEVTVILAADVIYHNQLTDAFLNAVLYLMKRKPNKVMFIALEKRYVFTIEDMDTVAPCYEHFVTGLKWLKNQETSTVDWSIQQIPSKDLHQYFTYERTKDLVLWKIESSIKS